MRILLINQFYKPDTAATESSCVAVGNVVRWNWRWQCVLKNQDESSTYGRKE